jgi:hypothetical protein
VAAGEGPDASLHPVRFDLTHPVEKQRLGELSENNQTLARGESGRFIGASGRGLGASGTRMSGRGSSASDHRCASDRDVTVECCQ